MTSEVAEKLQEEYFNSVKATKNLGVSLMLETDFVRKIITEFNRLYDELETRGVLASSDEHVVSTKEWDAMSSFVDLVESIEEQNFRDFENKYGDYSEEAKILEAFLGRHPRPSPLEPTTLEELLVIAESKGSVGPEEIRKVMKNYEGRK